MRQRLASFVIASLSCLVAPSEAQAASDFAGSYVAIEGGVSGGKGSREITIIDPARDDRYTYSPLPPSQQVVLKRNAPREPIGVISAGHLFAAHGVVLGFEGQLVLNGIDHATKLTPIQSDTSANGPGTLGGLYAAVDTVSSRFRVNGSGAVLARAGVPVGPVLFSVFGGPVVADARITLRQDSSLSGLYVSLPPNGTHFNYQYFTYESSRSATRRRAVFGGMIGGSAEAAITPRLAVRGSISATRLNAATASLQGNTGANSQMSFRARTYAWTVGLVRRF